MQEELILPETKIVTPGLKPKLFDSYAFPFSSLLLEIASILFILPVMELKVDV